ncbi:MAG TPA: histidine phosphatase family protein [Gemmatimonadales bacterium]|nr:histidine phosphatase family protein [Gemmatimonadales bacterium]
MLTIVLARHGKLAWNPWVSVPGRRLAEWQHTGATAPLDPRSRPSAALQRLVAASNVLVASPLRRSLESAAVLRPDAAPLVEPLVREVESPSAIPSGLRLPGKLWSILARFAWYAGWSPEVESHGEARRRAGEAAARLALLARAQGQILLIGHGIMNGLIGKQLHRTGWRGPRLQAYRHWGHAVYEWKHTASPLPQ